MCASGCHEGLTSCVAQDKTVSRWAAAFSVNWGQVTPATQDGEGGKNGLNPLLQTVKGGPYPQSNIKLDLCKAPLACLEARLSP